jgi:hypothetical protein
MQTVSTHLHNLSPQRPVCSHWPRHLCNHTSDICNSVLLRSRVWWHSTTAAFGDSTCARHPQACELQQARAMMACKPAPAP